MGWTRKFYFLLLGLQTSEAIMEIMIEFPQKERNRPSIRFICMNLGHTPKGVYTQL